MTCRESPIIENMLFWNQQYRVDHEQVCEYDVLDLQIDVKVSATTHTPEFCIHC